MGHCSCDVEYTKKFLVSLLNIPSPTGHHEEAINYCQAELQSLGCDTYINPKGALIARLKGTNHDKSLGLTAHVDTLGAMIKRIKPNGRLELTQLGGWAWGSVEGEGVTVITANNKQLRGTILPVNASVHIHGNEAKDFKRDQNAYEVRLDIKSATAEETIEQGIRVGDFVTFDPRVEVSETGFIRSRHLDDKAGVAAILSATHALITAGLQPYYDTTILISNYEEVGHGGAAGFPGTLYELLAVDMAAVGGEQNSNEFSVGICVKDSGGPYHIRTREKLIRLADEFNIPYKLDIYPYYGSDGEAYWRAGGEARVGLIGPGVDASHHYERTHIDSIRATADLIIEFLLCED